MIINQPLSIAVGVRSGAIGSNKTMSRVSLPRLPVAPTEPGETEDTGDLIPAGDFYRRRIMDNGRLSVMHTRIYDYWRPQVGAPTAYDLALVAFSNEAAYQALKRRVTNCDLA
jgi:hypothetical protein